MQEQYSKKFLTLLIAVFTVLGGAAGYFAPKAEPQPVRVFITTTPVPVVSQTPTSSPSATVVPTKRVFQPVAKPTVN